MSIIHIRRSAALVLAVAVGTVLVAASTAMACGRWPGGWGLGGGPGLDMAIAAGPGSEPAPAGQRGPGAPAMELAGRFGNGWLSPCDPAGHGGAVVGDARATASSGSGGCPAAVTQRSRTTSTTSPRAGTTVSSPSPGTGSRRSSASTVPSATTSRRAPAPTASAPTAPAPTSRTPVAVGATLWGPYTLTLSAVPPVVNPWQTGDLTATSSRLVATVQCPSRPQASVRITLYNAAVTTLASSPALGCDGRAHSYQVPVTVGATYYLSFSLTGPSVAVTATVSAA